MSTDDDTGGLAPADVSRHAERRFGQRLDAAALLARQWADATPMRMDRTGCHGDAIRYDPVTETVMVKNGPVIATVLRPDEPSVRDEVARVTGETA